MSSSALFPDGDRSAAQHVHTGNVACAIGYGQSFSWELSMLTLWSFDKAVTADAPSSTSLVVLTDTPSALAPHQAALPRLRVQRFNMGVMSSVWNISRPLLDSDAVWFRFMVQASYVERHCHDAALVMLFDLKDILFQSSPFALAPRAPLTSSPLETLTSFTEAFPIRRGSWNHKAMKHFIDNGPSDSAIVEEIILKRKLGLNSGILIGPPRVVQRHAMAVSRAVVGLKLSAHANMMGIDQGAHNLLVYRAMLAPRAPSETPPHTVIPMNLNATCEVLTLHMLNPMLYDCDEVDRSRPGSSVFRLRSSMSGDAFVMVHQWNRAPETVQRAVLCHHRHLLNVTRLHCGPRTSCRPYFPERSLVRQDEREMLHKLNWNKKVWQPFCSSTKTGCVTPESERIRLWPEPQ